jgi:hypothetical protein
MKHIYPNKIKLENLKIKEIKNKYLINIYYLNLNIYGIIAELNDIVIEKEYNKYKIILSENNLLEKYDNFLRENIQNYKQIVMNQNQCKYLEIPACKLMNEYYQSKTNHITIYINHVKKTGFFNIPIINIL